MGAGGDTRWYDDDASRLGIDGLVDASAIGEGGNAIVYRAFQPSLDRQVAVKVLKGLVDDDARRRFDRERKAMGRLSEHDGIVTVYASGFTRRGEPYLVMPLLPGSLEDELQSGPLPWTEAVAVMAEVCDTVGIAHESGVVHRDLKPGNIMRSRTGRALVADFGIARLMDASSSFKSTALTLTPAYSPPEALEATLASARADVYSLGATLFALIAGHAPFVDPAVETSLLALMRRIVDDPIPDLRPVIPDALQTVLERSMAKDPTERYDDAGQLAVALRAAGGETGPARDTGPDTPTRVVAASVPRTVSPTKPPAEPSQDEARSRSATRRRPVLVGASVCSLIAVGALVLTLGRSADDAGDAAATDASEDTVTPSADTSEAIAIDTAVTETAGTDAVATSTAAPVAADDTVTSPDDEQEPVPATTEIAAPDATVDPEGEPQSTPFDAGRLGPSDFEPYASTVLAGSEEVWTVVPRADETIVRVDPSSLDVADAVNVGFFAPTVTIADDWLAGAGIDGQLAVLDLASGELVRIDLDRRVDHLAAEGDDVWVTTTAEDGNGARLHRFDRRTLAEEAAADVGDLVLHLDAAGDRVWTATTAAIKAFDAATLTLVVDTTTGVSPIDDLDAFGDAVWVSGGVFDSELGEQQLARGGVVRLDAATGAASPVVTVSSGLSIFEEAAVAATDSGAWITIETTNEAFFVATDGTIGSTLELPDDVQAAEVVGDVLWVLAGGTSSGQLWAIDVPTG